MMFAMAELQNPTVGGGDIVMMFVMTHALFTRNRTDNLGYGVFYGIPKVGI
jgi:hypothetical protein